MFCTKCGFQVPDGAAECPACHANIAELYAEAGMTPPAAPAAETIVPEAAPAAEPVAEAVAAPAPVVEPAQPVAPVAQPQYAQPMQPQYAQPVQPQYAQPVQPQYAQPVQPQYAQPVQPQYAQPMQPQYVQPQFAAPTAAAPAKKKTGLIVGIIVGVVVLIGLVVGAIFLFSDGCSGGASGGSGSAENAMCNTDNWGWAVTDDNKIYFSDDVNGDSYVTDMSGGNVSRLDNDDRCYFLNYYEGKLYYFDGTDCIMRMDLDGRNSELIEVCDARYMVVNDGYIYYSDYDDENIYRIRTNGGDKMKIADGYSVFLKFYDGWLYYVDYNGDQVRRCRPDGSDNTLVFDEYCRGFAIYDGWLFYVDYYDGGKLCKVSLSSLKNDPSGSDRVVLSDNECDSFNISDDGTIFYSDSSIDALCSCDINGRGKKILVNHATKYVCVCGDYVFYFDDDTSTNCRMELDGSNAMEINPSILGNS